MVPKGIWSVVDGLTAIKWAWILIQLGTEKAVVAYVDWWIGKARLRSHQLDAVVEYTGMPLRTGLRRRCASAEPSTRCRERSPATTWPSATRPTKTTLASPTDQPKGKAKGKGARRRPGKRQRTTLGRPGERPRR